MRARARERAVKVPHDEHPRQCAVTCARVQRGVVVVARNHNWDQNLVLGYGLKRAAHDLLQPLALFV